MHALVKDPFKVHNRLMDFNLIKCEKFIYDYRFHIVTFKKQPLAEFWCNTKEEYLQLCVMTSKYLCEAIFLIHFNHKNILQQMKIHI